MRLITWNVNGITTLPQYHPWNTAKDYQGIIDLIDGDIVCIQETKITRAKMSESAKGNTRFSNATLAIMRKYDAFFSFYRSQPPRGIHGTAIYTKRSTCIPLKAEEGLSEVYVPSALAKEDRIGGYPSSSDLELAPAELAQLDGEGRAVVVDLGMFVLINLYCPNETDEHRLKFKNFYNEMVDQRVRNLVKAGREVIVVGDLNICVNEIDSAEYKEDVKKRGIGSFTSHPPRKWLSKFVSDKGVMIDLTRHFHPGRQGMFTCWNTKIDARPSNYGTRLDYILITPGLLPWVKFSDIMPSVTGSDHCPVYADFYEEREIDGKTVKLIDLLTPGRRSPADDGEGGPDAPAFAARFYEEFGAKQKTLKTFFTKGSSAAGGAASSGAPLPANVAPAVAVSREPSTFAPSASKSTVTQATASPSPVASSSTPQSKSTSFQATRSSKTTARDESRRSRSVSSSFGPFESTNKIKSASAADSNSNNGQKTLSSFFKPPPTPADAPLSSKKGKPKSKASKGKRKADEGDNDSQRAKKKVATTTSANGVVEILDDGDSDNAAPNMNASGGDHNASDEEDIMALAAAADEATAEQQQAAWSNLFAKKEAPLCAHGEPCKLWKVNKPGINKGREFYQCARPVGPGYQKERGGSATGEYRCGTWQWAGPRVTRPAGMVPYGGKR